MAEKYWWLNDSQQDNGSQKKKYWWLQDSADKAGANITDRVNTWLKNHNAYISNYQKRTSGRKYSYEDSYVGDSANWLSTISQQKSNFDAEADSILSYMDLYKDHLDKDWMAKVRDTLSSARLDQGKIFDHATKDNEWWSSFADEDQYNTYQRYDSYSNKYQGLTYSDIQKALGELEDSEEKDWLTDNQYAFYKNDSSYNSKAASGYKSYEAQKIAEQEAKQKEEDSKTQWDKASEFIVDNAYLSDNPLVNWFWNQREHYAEDQSYMEPNEQWNAEQKNNFGYLYSESPAKAHQYAIQVNNQINAQAQQNAQQAVGDWSSQNIGTGILGTLGAIATAPSGMADLLDNIVEYSARGTITQKGYITPYEFGQSAQSGISNKLNEYGTLDDDLFAIGGKGLGDVYSLGVSAANSLLSAYAFGGTGTLVNFIGQGGAAGVDDALSRGATAEQALLYGSIVGAAEGLTEMIPADKLLKVGSSATLKNYLMTALKQGIGEFTEEGASSIISNVADIIIMQGKSNFNAMVKKSMASEGLSREEAEAKAWKKLAGDAVFDAMGGFATGAGNAALVGGFKTAMDSWKGNQANIDAIKQYGGVTGDLIQEGLQNDTKSDSYKLAQKYKERTDSGKALTGFQIRNLLAANKEQVTEKDIQKIEQATAERLVKLGQKEDVSKIAKLATKYVTGGELSRSEKNFLANSKNGAAVTSEMLSNFPAEYSDKIGANKLLSKWENDMADGMIDNYSSEWAANIGTESVSRAAFDQKRFEADVTRAFLDALSNTPASYKPLTDRVGTEARYSVSDDGQATNRKTGEAITLGDFEVTKLDNSEMTIKPEVGEEAYAGDIDFEDDDKAYAFSAVSNIENITPAGATAMLKAVDFSKPVSAQLNGLDEAYTHGFHGYSEAELKAGKFTKNLTDEQMMTAYEQGKAAQKESDDSKEIAYKKMRTAADAKVTSEQKAAKQKARLESDDVEVYFEDGGTVVKFDEHGGQYDDKRMAAVNTAKFLSKLGIGGKYYFYESYVKGNKRVYKDADGNEVDAPNGVYRAEDGSIHIDLNAGNMGQGTALYTLGHELGHFIKDKSSKQFKVLSDLVTEAYDQTDMSMHKRVLAKQKFLSDLRGKNVSYNEAFEEVVADALSTMLSDGSFYEKLMEIKVKDKGLFNTIKEFFEKLIAKFKKAYEGLSPEQKDARDIRELKDMFDKIQTAFVEGLVEASENFQASEQVLAESGIAVNSKTESGSLLSVRDVLNDKERKKVAKALAERFNVTEKEAMDWLKAETSLASIILNPKYSAFLDYEAGPNEVAIKQNSDYPQGTVDFSNICKKRREFTQVMNRILRNFPNHVFAATDLAKIRTIMGEEGMTLPCGICYVEDRRQLDSIVAQDFIDGLKLYREGSKTRPDGKPFNANQLKGLQLTDGDTYVPSIYELVTLEGRNSLKEKNPNMEAAWVKYNNARGMQAVRLLTNEAEYKRQILKYTPKTVQTKNDYGGLRIYSFSDAEMFHLIDIIQVLTDCAAVGLKVQGYTKVNEYAKAVKDTGEKLNRSLIPLGDLGYHMENGKVVLDYDPVEGIDIHSEDFFDSKDNPNVGNIVIGINPTQIRAAMVSDFVDYIIPFHTGQSAEVLGEKGIAAWVNYKDSQSEIDLATGKKSAHQINIYTEVFQAAENEGNPIRNKRDFVDKFLAVCKKNGLKPRFAEFLNTDANGDYVYTEGYHKFLVDFKTFAQTEVGEYLPQMPVKPLFDNAYITGLLEAYVKEQRVKDAEVAKQMPKVIDRITNEIVMQSEGSASRLNRDYLEGKRFSHRDTSAVPQDITAFVDKSLNYRNTNDTMEITIATKWDNSAINKLGRSWSGKYTGSKRVITGEYVRHIINRHGNAFLEALQGQLYMDGDAIKIALSNLRAGKGRVIGGTYSRRGNPTIVTEIPINGYTLYAEEPLENLRGLEIEGRTIYMKPTSTTALKPTQRAGSIPQRRDGLTTSIDATSRIVNNFLADADGKLVELHGVDIQNLPNVARRTYGTVALSTDVNALNTVYSHISNNTFKVRVQNPYIVESGHPIIVDEDFYDGNKRRTAAEVIIEKLDMIKAAGYDSIIMDYKSGDNYFVIVFDRNAVEPYVEEDSKTTYRSSERGDGTSNRSLLANAFEGITKSSIEYKLIQEYKDRIKQLNEQEERLSELNAEIRKIRFGTTGTRDTARLTELESEAKEVAKEINRHDKKLLSLEASEPLRNVIERERKKEAQKTKDHVEEIQQNKRVRAEQTELRYKIRKTIRDLDKILKHGNKRKNVKEDLQPVVTKALQAAEILFTDNYGTYDMLRNGIGADMSDAEEALVNSCAKMLQNLDKMPTDGYENWQARQEAENRLKTKMSKLKDVFARERKRLNNTTVSSILGELADAYASLEKSEQSYVQGAYSEAVHNFLKSLQQDIGGTIVKDMTKDQLESVYAAYKMVLTTVRKANTMFNEELKMSRAQLGNAVIEEVRKAGGVNLLGTKLGDAISQALWNNMKPIWVANRIGSETFGKLMLGLFKGQYNFAVDIEEAKQFKLSMDEKYHPREWDAEKLYDFESSTGKPFSLNLQQIMSLYAFSKREQAFSHLLNGGFVFENNSTVIVEKDGKKKTYIHKGATSYKLNEATINEIIDSLTAEQKAYVDEMQAYLSDVMGAKGNEVSMKLYGIKMFNEKFYFPLRSSGAYMERAKEAELKKQQGQINLVNSGFTHAVKPEAKNPIILSGFKDVWAEHCNEMSMYHSMVLPMEDFRKVYNYSTVHDENFDSASVYQTIQDAYGDAATAYIDQLYRELNAGATIDPRETPYKQMISNFKKSAVMLSASVVVQQFSAIGRAFAYIDPTYFNGAKIDSGTNLSVVDEMKKYAPVAIIKEMGGFDTGTKGSAKSYIMAEKYSKGERKQALLKDEQYRGEVMGYLPAKADEKTWCAIWEAVKRETNARHPEMDVKSEEFLKLVGERFSEVIERTQVYDSVLARSANMRSKGGLMQMATAFMAEPTTTINLLEDVIRSGNKKQMARTFGAVAVSIVLNNALASIVYAMRDDDEDETLIEKYFQSFTSGMIDDINPMTYYPFLKDVWSLFQGYDVERTDMSVIADLRDAMKKTVSLLGKDTSSMDDDELAEHSKNVWGTLGSLLDAGCSVFGVPFKNIRREAKGIINTFSTIGKDLSGRTTTWNSFWDKVGSAVKDTIPGVAWTKGETKSDQLYDAIVSGDKSYAERIKATYKDESSYRSAVRRGLRDNDSRIHEAAQARADGNIEEYKRIFKEIQKEGKFTFDDIMSAINSEESSIQRVSSLEKDYLEYAEPAGISMDVFASFLQSIKGLETKYDEWGDVEVSKRDQVLEIIDSLPLTWKQKDALYLAAGYAESKIWDVPW